MKQYTFNLRPPKDFENKLIEVAAENKTDAKKLIIKELNKINKKFVEVFVLTKKKRKELNAETDQEFAEKLMPQTYFGKEH